jgi:O-antigen/teichoic acid export membrane protein
MLSAKLGHIRAVLGHRAFAALLDQGAVSLASFGTGILLSRAFVGPERVQLGLYYLAVTIGILIVEVQNALVSTPHMVTAPTLKPELLRQFNGSALIHHAALSGIITVILVFFALGAPAMGLASHQAMLIACAVTAAGLGVRNFARFLNFALHRPGVACIADWVVTILQLAGILVLVRTHRLSAWSAVGVIGLASFAGGVLALGLSAGLLRIHISRAWRDFRDNWRLSRWVFGSGVVWNIGTNFYPWMIDRFSSALQTAVWGNCNAVSSLGNPLLMGLQNWIAPAVAHAYTDRTRERFRAFVFRGAMMFVALLPAMVLVLCFISNPLLHRVYRDPTADTLMLVLVLAAGSVVQSASFVISRGLFSLGRGDFDLWANMVPVIVLVAPGYLLVHRYGALGGAVSLLVAQVLSTAVRAVMFWFAAMSPGVGASDVRLAEAPEMVLQAEAM